VATIDGQDEDIHFDMFRRDIEFLGVKLNLTTCVSLEWKKLLTALSFYRLPWSADICYCV
jgi:hypothetical protein